MNVLRTCVRRLRDAQTTVHERQAQEHASLYPPLSETQAVDPPYRATGPPRASSLSTGPEPATLNRELDLVHVEPPASHHASPELSPHPSCTIGARTGARMDLQMLKKHDGGDLSSIREFDFHKPIDNDIHVEIERDVSVATICIRDAHLSTSICLNSDQARALYSLLPEIMHARDIFQDSLNCHHRMMDSF
jgi:hypothetical protein